MAPMLTQAKLGHFKGLVHMLFLNDPLTLIGMSYKNKKYAHIYGHLGSLAGCQIIPIDVNFHHQKGLEFFD